MVMIEHTTFAGHSVYMSPILILCNCGPCYKYCTMFVFMKIKNIKYFTFANFSVSVVPCLCKFITKHFCSHKVELINILHCLLRENMHKHCVPTCAFATPTC